MRPAAFGYRPLLVIFLVGIGILPTPLTSSPAQPAKTKLDLLLRTRVETEKNSGRYHALTRQVQWDAAKTAVVICDMWDKHWCPGASARVAEMAPRMNEVVAAARKRGALIIHCPSDTMDYYKD